jgi:hypothetical protein
VLHNPRYAGAFFYGRRADHRRADGTMTTRVLPREEWTVLITDSHPGYISWEQFEANQIRLATNATAHGHDRRASPPREGPALLQGLVICGKCGGRMTVRYQVRKGNQVPEYVCQSDGIQHGKTICQPIPGAGIDANVGRFLLDTVTPLALETALAVADELTTRADDADRIRAAAVQRAQYHADLAASATSRSTPPTDWSPTNSKPHGTARCANSGEATDTYERARTEQTGPLSQTQRDAVTALASDFPTL